ncbi:MAG TPA: DegQ family serine endoprotease [Pedomonas sp.]|nr:DegQ family serine endoprotease [Pedomonas sp.]
MRSRFTVLRSAMLAVALASTAIGAVHAPAMARPAPESFADLAAQLQPAVVNISTTQQVEVGRQFPGMPQLQPGSPLEEFFRRFMEERGQGGSEGEPITREARSLGSGFIIDPDGYIVTNNHVITGRDGQTVVDKITVILNDDRRFEAKVVGRDPATDLALLKIDAKGLPHVQWGDSTKARVGDWVLAIGNPFGLGVTVTAGIVSALHREIGVGQYDRLIQTDASINRGNSGGPMFDNNGKVIGIATAILSPTGGNIGIGFAIPADQAKPIVEQLRTLGKVRRGWLGVRIQPVTEDIAAGLGFKEPKGAIVAGVEDNTPAAQAGVLQGDVILKFNGKEVTRQQSLQSIVSDTTIGSTVNMEILREGKPATLRVTVAERPDGDGLTLTPEAQPDEAGADEGRVTSQHLGLGLQPLTPEVRQRLGLGADVTGVVISNVNPASDAAAKGLRPGDVLLGINQKRVSTPTEAAALVDEARAAGRDAVVLLVQRGPDVIHIGVKMVAVKEKTAAKDKK